MRVDGSLGKVQNCVKCEEQKKNLYLKVFDPYFYITHNSAPLVVKTCAAILYNNQESCTNVSNELP